MSHRGSNRAWRSCREFGGEDRRRRGTELAVRAVACSSGLWISTGGLVGFLRAHAGGQEGSEMCIRDSGPTCQRPRPLPACAFYHCQPGPARQVRLPRPRNGRAATTVRYLRRDFSWAHLPKIPGPLFSPATLLAPPSLHTEAAENPSAPPALLRLYFAPAPP